MILLIIILFKVFQEVNFERSDPSANGSVRRKLKIFSNSKLVSHWPDVVSNQSQLNSSDFLEKSGSVVYQSGNYLISLL